MGYGTNTGVMVTAVEFEHFPAIIILFQIILVSLVVSNFYLLENSVDFFKTWKTPKMSSSDICTSLFNKVQKKYFPYRTVSNRQIIIGP